MRQRSVSHDYRDDSKKQGGTMHKEIKLQRAGGSSAVTLPKAMLERFHLETGDTAYVVETEDGILITPFDPTFGRAMALAERGAKRYRNALRELAK